MRPVVLTLVLAVVCTGAAASGTAAPPTRSLLNYGDSLAVGTGSFLEPYLSAGLSMTTHGSAAIRMAVRGLRSYGAGSPACRLGQPRCERRPARREWFKQQVLGVLEIAGESRCVIWSTVVSCRSRGVRYDGFNDVLRELDRGQRRTTDLRLGSARRREPAGFGATASIQRRRLAGPRAAGVARLAKACS